MEREDWNRRYATKELVWTATANRFLTAEVGALPPGRALDLAAGEGRNAIWLAERGWTVRAVDFSDVAAEKGQRFAAARSVAERVRFEVADLRDYVPEPHGFDLVTIVYLQIPADELTSVIRRAARAVAPGGTFLLVGHDATNLTRGYGGPQDPRVLYSPDLVVAAIGDELELVKAETVERLVETDDGPRVAVDCLVRAARRR